MKTTNLGYHPTPLTPQYLVGIVWNKIIQGLQDAQIPTQDLSKQLLAFALPRHASQSWEILVNQPLFLPDDDMVAILNLRRSTPATPPPAQGNTLFYIRSFCLSIGQLIQMIANRETEGKFEDESLAWKIATELAQDEDQPVWIRYVGLSSSESGWGRHEADIYNRSAGIFGAFVKARYSISASIVENCAVFEFPLAQTQAFRKPDGTI
ncbi:uncharacterized protein K452DRAFT_236227, partial [Aplosporella prunicola CBS 121167]